MNEATVAQTILTLGILLIFLAFLVWGIRSGQFKDVEEANRHILTDTKNKNGSPLNIPEEGDKSNEH